MLELIKKLYAGLLVIFILAIPSATIAEGINFKNFKLLGSSPSYQVLTGVEFGLTNYLQNALNNGISLNTRIQFRVQQNRDWWFDKEKTLLTIHYQLKYHALSQHYLLTRNDTNEHWNFSNLSSALRKLGELRKYSLPPIKTPLDSDNYSLFVIAEMSPATLRLPLRIQSLFSDKYRLASEGVLWPLP